MRRSSRKRVLADVSTRANSHTSPSPTFSSIAAVPSTRSSSAPVGASSRFDGVEAEIQKDEAKNALTEAAQSGNAAECRRLLREGRNDARSDGSGTRSAQNGKAQKRESNFDPNQRWHGWTPLMHAAAHGFVDVLAALLADSRVEVDAGDTEFGATALLLAAGNGQVGAVRLLLEDGRAEPNATAFDGSTALSRATYTAARGSTAPHLANVRKRALDVIRLMLSDPRIDPNCTPQVRITLPFSTDAIEAKSDREGKDLRQKDGMDNEIHGTNNSAIPSSNSNFSRCSSGGSSSSMEGATALKQQLQLRRSGTTALMFAVGSGDLTLVEALLSSNKLDPNVRSTSQMRTALHRAASHGFTTIVASFLRDGRADPSLEDANGNTALIIAADKGHLGVVNMLLGGVDVTECTPGVFCKEFDVDEEEYEEEEDCKKAESCRGRKRKRQQQIASTKLILMVGQTELDRKGTVVLPAETRLRADPTRQQQVETDKQQQQRQHYWSEASKNRVSPNTENRNGSTALIHAACHGHCRVVQRLLADERTDPNKTSTYNGNTALGWAANRGHCDVVAALLADDRTAANASDQKNRTALARAAQKGHWKVVQEMLKHASVDRNARDFRGHTALIHAVGYHHKEVVQLLLADPQVDPNASGYHHDRTALHRCASLGFGAMVQLLLGDERLDTNKSDCQGCTALYHAAVMGHSGCTETLLGDERVDLNQANVNGHTPLYAAAEKGHAPVVSSLLADPRVDPMSVTEGGFTALTGAAHYGHTSVVDIFLRDGRVDPNGANEQGITALTYAAHKGHAEVVKVLLGDERVDPNIADNRNCGSLYHAASLGHTKAVAALLADKRVDLNVVCTSNRRTALMRALQKEHIAVAELLLADGRCMRPRVVDTVVGEPLPAEAMHATGVGAETQDATDMQAAGGTVGENGSSSSSSTDPSTVEPVSIFSSRSSQPQRLRTLGVITGEVARSCYRSALRHVKRPRLARFRGIVRCLIQLKKLRLRAAERAYAPPPTCSTRDGGFMLYANNAACTSSPTCLVETAADRTEQREVQQQDVSRVTNTAKECKQNAITEHEEESNDSVADLDESVSTIITNTGSIWDETTLERHVSSNSDRMESDSDNASCDESFELAQLTDGLEDDLSYEVGMIGTARTENAMTTRRSSKRRRIDDISTDSKGAAGSCSSHERIGGAGFFAAERDFNARVRKFA